MDWVKGVRDCFVGVVGKGEELSRVEANGDNGKADDERLEHNGMRADEVKGTYPLIPAPWCLGIKQTQKKRDKDRTAICTSGTCQKQDTTLSNGTVRERQGENVLS